MVKFSCIYCSLGLCTHYLPCAFVVPGFFCFLTSCYFNALLFSVYALSAAALILAMAFLICSELPFASLWEHSKCFIRQSLSRPRQFSMVEFHSSLNLGVSMYTPWGSILIFRPSGIVFVFLRLIAWSVALLLSTVIFLLVCPL